MICILINQNDTSGLWLFRSLAQTGRKNIKLISAEELIYAPSFECGFQNGKAFFSIRLHDGFWFTDSTVSAVINLIQFIPSSNIQYFKSHDQQYVQSELNAIYTFLFSIIPNSIFNESTGSGICGRNRSFVEWFHLAQQAGFQIPTVIYENGYLAQQSESADAQVQTMLFFHGKCYCPNSADQPGVITLCERLGQLAGEKIMEINYSFTNDRPFFLAAHTHPRFLNGPLEFIDDLNLMLPW